LTNSRKPRFKLFAAVAFAVIAASSILYFSTAGNPIRDLSPRSVLRNVAPGIYSTLRNYVLAYDPDVPGMGKERGLPLFKLHFSRADVEHFRDLMEHFGIRTYRDGAPAYYVQNNNWRKATLEYHGETYRIKVKAHSNNPSNHYNWGNISYAVKLDDDRQIYGRKRFSLIVRSHIKPEKQITFDLAEKFGVIASREFPVRVSVNGGPEAIYYFDPRLSEDYMENINRSSFRLFDYTVSEDKARIKSSIYPTELYDPVVFRKRLLETLTEKGYPDNARQAILQRYTDLQEAINDNRSEIVPEMFDLDYISSFEAVRTIACHKGHSLSLGNLYIFYDTASGKFYPVFTRDAVNTRMTWDGGFTIESQVNHELHHVLGLVASNDEVRQMKYRKIYNFILDYGDDIEALHRKKIEYHQDFSYLGRFLELMRRVGLYHDDIANHNLRILGEYLRKSEPEAGVATSGDRLIVEILPRSMSALGFENLAAAGCSGEEKFPVEIAVLTYKAGKLTDSSTTRGETACTGGSIDLKSMLPVTQMSTATGEEFQSVPRKYVFIFSSPRLTGNINPGELKIEFTNTVTGQAVPATRLYRLDDDAVDSYENSLASIEPAKNAELIPGYSDIPENISVMADGEVVFHKGEHVIRRDFVLPDGYRLVIEAGAKVLLGENVALSGNGGIDVRGTPGSPAVITALDPERPFGSVGILGNGGAVSRIDHLHLSNGNERWIRGAYFSGGLSIHYNREVHISNSRIERNNADDGLNIKYAGMVVLENNIFENNFADQVDLDYCHGIVRGNLFRELQPADKNGDGLDVSGSRIIALDNTFSGFADKGLSIGENTDIFVTKNSFSGNNMGAAVKDLSDSFFIDNSFSDNAVDISAYQKKDIFGGGNVYLPADTATRSRLKYRLDNRSNMFAFRESWVPPIKTAGVTRESIDVMFEKLFSVLENPAYSAGEPPR